MYNPAVLATESINDYYIIL